MLKVPDKDLPDFIEDVLISTYVSLFGRRPPGDWVFKPKPYVAKQLTEMLKQPDAEQLKRYLQQALCFHCYPELKQRDKSPTPFFNVNTRLVQETFVSQLLSNADKIWKKFQNFLDQPSAFYQQVYSEIFSTEVKYLGFAFSKAYHGVEIPWIHLSPTPCWYLFCVVGFDGYPINRKFPDESIKSWKNQLIYFNDAPLKLDDKLPALRANLSVKSVRAVFFDTATRALEEAALKWAIDQGFTWQYEDPVHAGSFKLHPKSLVTKANIRPSFPLAERDQKLFEEAKAALAAKNITLSPLPEGTAVGDYSAAPPTAISRIDTDRLDSILAEAIETSHD